MSRWRGTLREAAESTLVALGAPAFARRWRGDHRLILAYHNVVTDPAALHGDASLHLPLSAFCAQMRALTQHYTVVPLAALRSAPTRLDRARVAITFDDAYTGAVRNALPYLADAALPVTMFVAPGRLGGLPFWWDAVAGPEGPGPSAGFRRAVIDTLGGDDARAMAQAERFGLHGREVPRECLTASEAELVVALAENPFLTLGSHSWSHASLAGLPHDALRRELEDSHAWLRRFATRGTPWIAYPYGRVDRLVEREAQRAGFAGGVRVGGGAIARRAHGLFSLPRVNIAAHVSPRGFELRAAGVVR